MSGADRQRDILLAEDSPTDTDLVRFALREYGRRSCRLHVVPDGERALAFLRKEGYTPVGPAPTLSF
jgi:CheY-like chemotaxis protein